LLAKRPVYPIYLCEQEHCFREQGGAPPRSSHRSCVCCATSRRLDDGGPPTGLTACGDLCRSCRRLRIGSRLRSLRQLLQRSTSHQPSACLILIWVLILLLILGAPSNHAGRNPMLIRRANRHGCRFSRTGPGMALCGGAPNQCRITGIPSLGEGPSGGARAFCLLLGFQK